MRILETITGDAQTHLDDLFDTALHNTFGVPHSKEWEVMSTGTTTQGKGILPTTDRKAPLHPHAALVRYSAIREAIEVYHPQALAPDDLKELQYLKGQLDRAQEMAVTLSGLLSTLWDAQTNNETDHTDMPQALWLAHEYAELMVSVGGAYGHVQQRILQHYQAVGGCTYEKL